MFIVREINSLLLIQEPGSMSIVQGKGSLFIFKETGSVFIITGTKAPGTDSVYSLRNWFFAYSSKNQFLKL